jgi:hypothetical protein
VTSTISGDLLACGDKFLVPSRGVRFELTPAARQQAAILLYVNPASSLPGIFARLSIDPALRKAGYRPTEVASADELDRTLRQGSWDVLLVDLADDRFVALSDLPGSPIVLAVTVSSISDRVRAGKRYATILRSPTRSQAFVDALDVAVAKRHAALAKTKLSH